MTIRMILEKLKKYIKEDEVFKINRVISNWYVLPAIILLVDMVALLLITYLISLIGGIPSILKNTFSGTVDAGAILSIKNAFNWSLIREILKLWPLIVIVDIYLFFKIRTAFSEDYFNLGQKGTGRFTTYEEIKEQYLEIDEKDIPYPGTPGVIVSRYEDKLYIDQSWCNNVYYGVTRIGKGEMFVGPNLEVMSRAEIKPSVLLIDMKLELYKMYKKMLEKRGYLVLLLNMIDPEHSMGYNKMSAIIKLWKSGDVANAELLAKSTASMFFASESEKQGEMKYFSDTASDVLCAFMIATIEDCLEEDVNYNNKRKLYYNRKIKAYQGLSEKEKKEADKIFKEIQKKSEDIIMEDNIFAIPEDYEYYKVDKYEKCINFYSIMNNFIELATIKFEDGSTAVDTFFNNRPKFDRAKMKFIGAGVAGDRTKGSIYSEMVRQLGNFSFENIAKMTAESSIDLEDIGFGDKPIAIFLGVPSHDKSRYYIPTLFIRQVYFVLAQRCTETGVLKRPVKIVADEIGNFPKIEELTTITSFGQGLGISVDLYIQSTQQMKDVYGDNYKTIIENCSNRVWIMSNNKETAEDFIKQLGSETKVLLQRNGGKFDINKNFYETIDEHPLRRVDELMNYKEGECLILRTTKRKDLMGNDITPWPIENTIENGRRLKYAYQYLTDRPNPQDVKLSEINTEDCSHINPRERTWDYRLSKAFKQDMWESDTKEKQIKDLSERKHKSLNDSLKNALGNDVLDRWDVTGNTSIEELIDKIKNTKEMAEKHKAPIIQVLEEEL